MRARTTRNKRVACLLLFTGLALVAPGMATQVFRWTGEDGQVHYGQRPPPQGAHRIELGPSAPGAGRIDPETEQRLGRQRRVLDAYAYEREQKQTRAERAAEEQRQTAARCQELQRYWQQLSFPGPLYVSRDDGQRDYLSDKQRAAQKAELRPAYVQACGREP